MSEFGSWITSIVGCVLLTSLIDLCLQDGETKKFVKIVCSLLVFTVILAPFTSLLSSDESLFTPFSVKTENSYESEYALKEQAFIISIKEKEYENLKSKVISSLKNKGIEGIEISVVYDSANNAEILKILVNTQNSVIIDETANIDISKEIKDEVTFYFDVEDNLVEILSDG